MSFICGFCKQSTPVGQPMKRVVTETREKENRDGRRITETVKEKAWCGCASVEVKTIIAAALSASAVTAS
jgi:L-lactate utilization protein LutB